MTVFLGSSGQLLAETHPQALTVAVSVEFPESSVELSGIPVELSESSVELLGIPLVDGRGLGPSSCS